MFMVVHFNYGGNWTALFLIGSRTPFPAAIAPEKLYIFSNNSGYDGQSFHVTAHDPFMRRFTPAQAEIAPFRYARILVPALAWMLAFGRDSLVDGAYFLVILGFVFLGAYWLAMFAARASLHPAWGLAFLLSPATLTSVDRMTVDVALAALCMGLVLYANSSPNKWVPVLILAGALLTRETAWILFVSYGVFLLWNRRFSDAFFTALAAVPLLAWEAYLAMKTGFPNPPHLLGWIPLQGYFRRLAINEPYDLSPRIASLAVTVDYVALIGMGLAVALVIRIAIRNRTRAIEFGGYQFITFASVGYAFAVVFLNGEGEWMDAFAFGRIFAPLLLLLALDGMQERFWLGLAPTLLVDSRIALNFGSHAQQVIQKWIS
jgi:hypothetical protein